jgi:hypothetical protein
MDVPSSFKCPWCEASFENLENSLRVHVAKKHKHSSKELYDVLFGSAVCQCGCGRETKFHGLAAGYSKFIRGHVARVHNNWGHNEEALKRSHETCRELRKAGEMVIWNKGLSKEEHPSLKKQAETYSAHYTEDHRMQASKRMREMRLSGQIPTLTGPEHSQWRGGTSSIAQLSRSRLYREWIKPHLIASGFKCTSCGSTRDLEVHHDKERFAEILHKAVEVTGGAKDNEDFEGKQAAADWVVDYHVRENVSGVVLCENCHSNEHRG